MSVCSPTTTSTRGIRCPGNQKWVETVRSGNLVYLAISDILRPDVLEVMGISLGSSPSTCLKTICFNSRFSDTASITIPAFFNASARSASGSSSPSARFAGWSAASPLEQSSLTHFKAWITPPSALSLSTSTITVGFPARALTAAIPLPIRPPPIITILSLIDISFNSSIPSSGNNRTGYTDRHPADSPPPG